MKEKKCLRECNNVFYVRYSLLYALQVHVPRTPRLCTQIDVIGKNLDNDWFLNVYCPFYAICLSIHVRCLRRYNVEQRRINSSAFMIRLHFYAVPA